MTTPKICEEPGCGGEVVDQVCRRCKVRYDGNPEAEALAATTQGVVSVKPILSGLSRQSAVPDEPLMLADISLPADSAKRKEETRSVLADRLTLGSGIVQMPDVPHVDRASQIDYSLRTPRTRRFCSTVTCEDPFAKPDEKGKRPRPQLFWPAQPNAKLLSDCRLEDDTDEMTGKVTTYYVPDRGNCRHCGTPFDFLPMAKGTMIDQVRVDGPFTFGADGFVYHATDTELGRPIVIKAQHNSINAGGEGMASHEVGALVSLQGQDGALRVIGFKRYQGRVLILMEWLDGSTLFDVRVNNNGPLPLEVGLSYLLGVIAQVRNGHDLSPSILHLDIKPQNVVILAPGDALKLIDYGGCIIEGKPGKPIATEGYNAPELVPSDPINRGRVRGPSKASDVFSLGRLFCFLCLPFSITGKYRYTLPSPSDVAVFSEIESVYRFVRRLTAINPDERMTLAEAHEAAVALRNEVIALKDRRAMPSPSTIFKPDSAKAVELSFRTIPELCVDPRDEAALKVELALAEPSADQQRDLLMKAVAEFPASREGLLRLAALASDQGDTEFASRSLNQLMKQFPFDWRIVYYLGRLHGIMGDYDQAARCFDACYSACPADVAIKLANGLCAEKLGQNAMASRFYETAAWVNPLYVAGPFGWARCASRANDWATAIEAYSRVPRTSWAFNQALIGRVQALIHILSGATAKGIGLNELQEAATSADCILAEGESYEGYRVKADVLLAAIAALKSGSLKADKTIKLLGVPLLEGRLRDAASQALKSSARNTNDMDRRIELIDEARRVGRITLFGGK